MGLFRHGGDEAASAVHFKMREKMLSIGDDYWIENDAVERVFRVNGKAMRVRDTWVLEDGQGREVAICFGSSRAVSQARLAKPLRSGADCGSTGLAPCPS